MNCNRFFLFKQRIFRQIFNETLRGSLLMYFNFEFLSFLVLILHVLFNCAV